MEDLDINIANLRLSDQEQQPVPVEGLEDDFLRSSLCLAGKLLSTRRFNAQALMNTFKSVWNPAHGMAARSIGNDIFIFQFFDKADQQHALLDGPWCFDDYLLILQEIPTGVRPPDLIFSHAAFWVVASNIPLGCAVLPTARAIGNRIGKFVDWDDSDFLGLGGILRIRVRLDVTSPLWRQVTLILRGIEAKLPLQYERLPSFCFNCGCLGHLHKSCPSPLNAAQVPQFGAWLRTSPPKARARIRQEDMDKERVWFNKYMQRASSTTTTQDPKEHEGVDDNTGNQLLAPVSFSAPANLTPQPNQLTFQAGASVVRTGRKKLNVKDRARQKAGHSNSATSKRKGGPTSCLELHNEGLAATGKKARSPMQLTNMIVDNQVARMEESHAREQQ